MAYDYIKEIENTDWVQETITEKFDNALGLMTKNSVVFGGAIRDCVAGFPLEGDLDIVVSSVEGLEVTKNFANNPKWIACNKAPVLRKGGYAALPISGVHSYVNNSGYITQIIITKDPAIDPMGAVLNFARSVDIVCCGMVMMYNGRVYEVIDNAYTDALNKVLNINKEAYNTVQIAERLAMLEKRGWKIGNSVKKDLSKINKSKTKVKAPSLDERLQSIQKGIVERSIASRQFKCVISPYGHVDTAQLRDMYKNKMRYFTRNLEHVLFKIAASFGIQLAIGEEASPFFCKDGEKAKYQFDMIGFVESVEAQRAQQSISEGIHAEMERLAEHELPKSRVTIPRVKLRGLPTYKISPPDFIDVGETIYPDPTSNVETKYSSSASATDKVSDRYTY